MVVNMTSLLILIRHLAVSQVTNVLFVARRYGCDR